MRLRLFFFFFSVVSFVSIGQNLTATEASISFFSNAPIEDIFAESNKCEGVVDLQQKKFSLVIGIATFNFKNPLMKTHFNESYMETNKFPTASLEGVIDGDFDLKKNGVYQVYFTGPLVVHGVIQNRKIAGKIIVHDRSVAIISKFAIQLEKHGILVPQIMREKIAEIVEVSVLLKYVLQ